MPFVFQVCRARSTNNLHSQILASLFVFSALLPRHFELGPFVPKSRFCLSLGDVSLPAVSDPRPLLPGLSRNLSDTIWGRRRTMIAMHFLCFPASFDERAS